MFNPPMMESRFSILEFVVARFMHDIGMYVSQAMQKKVTVAPATHSEYFNPKIGFQAELPKEIQKIVEGGTTKALLPAITIGDINESRNGVLFRNQQVCIPKSATGDDGLPIEVYDIFKAPTIMDIGLSIRLYDDDPRVLMLMKRVMHQYFELHPYLFIPADLTEVDGVLTQPERQQLIREWFTVPAIELSKPGIFVDQGFADRSGLFSSTMSSSIDNVVMADTSVTIEGIPAPDNYILSTNELFKAWTLTIYDWSNEDNTYEVITSDSKESV